MLPINRIGNTMCHNGFNAVKTVTLQSIVAQSSLLNIATGCWYQLDDRLPEGIYADEKRQRQVLITPLGNAASPIRCVTFRITAQQQVFHGLNRRIDRLLHSLLFHPMHIAELIHSQQNVV